MSNVNNLFKELGYDERESQVYTHLLKNLEDSVMGIAKATSIPRTTVYTILSKLKKDGLVSIFRKNKQQFWVAENPQNLKSVLEKKSFAFDQLLPLLKELSGKDRNKSSVRLYTGKGGVQLVWEDIIETLERKQTPYVYGFSHIDLFKLLPKYFPEWLKRREKTKTFAKLILSENYQHLKSIPNVQEVREVSEKYVFSGDITIYGSKVAMFIFDQKEPEALIIDSPAFTEMMLGMFNFAWDMLGEGARV